tara:strand:- start:136 stop:312 length:177 start_codon:yes stop_codon:yes gene_type:complete
MSDSEDLTYENESYIERHSCNNCSRLETLIKNLKQEQVKFKLEIKNLKADAKELLNYP